VITLNEERNIARCLASVSGLAHEIVVVDSGSTDRTREIAAGAGAVVLEREWSGYGPQKQFALDHATCDWLLCLDADEWLDDRSREAIAGMLDAPPPAAVSGFRLRLRTRYLGRWVDHGAWSREWKLRLLRRGAGAWRPDVVHEGIELHRGRSERLPGRILHDPYRDLAAHLRTVSRYARIIAERDQQTSRARVLFGVILEPPLVFLQKYVLQLGIRDGWRGLVGAGMMSWYFFLRHAMIWERQQRR
jgi:glycosyltransferase involved in cell wall biosynthesis